MFERVFYEDSLVHFQKDSEFGSDQLFLRELRGSARKRFTSMSLATQCRILSLPRFRLEAFLEIRRKQIRYSSFFCVTLGTNSPING